MAATIESAGPGVRLSSASRVTFPALSVVKEGETFIVGDPLSANFITIPEIGVVVLRALQAGRTVAEATQAATEAAGEDVDVLDFVTVLLDVGLVRGIDGAPVGDHGVVGQDTWLESVPPSLVRPFFSRAAWVFYGLVALYCACIFCLRPAYWPSFRDFFFTSDPAICVVAWLAARMLLASVHEVWHWLAARAAGVGARFRVSRRLYYVVFETDLSQLWSLPRRARLSPLLAGMAFDVLVLAAALSFRLLAAGHAIGAGGLEVRIAEAVVLGQLIVIGWQMMVFLRTDLYAVLITLLGCTNLYRVNELTLKRRFHRLSDEERIELERAHPTDLRAVRWFSWLSIAGLLWAAYVFCAVFIPTTVLSAIWMFARLGSVQLGSRSFWEALILGVIFSLDFVWPAAIFIRERRATRSG